MHTPLTGHHRCTGGGTMKKFYKNLRSVAVVTTLFVGIALTCYAYPNIGSPATNETDRTQKAATPTSEPEPEVLLLLGVGLISLAVSARRTKK